MLQDKAAMIRMQMLLPRGNFSLPPLCAIPHQKRKTNIGAFEKNILNGFFKYRNTRAFVKFKNLLTLP